MARSACWNWVLSACVDGSIGVTRSTCTGVFELAGTCWFGGHLVASQLALVKL